MKKTEIIEILTKYGRVYSDGNENRIKILESIQPFTKVYGKEYELYRKGLLAYAEHDKVQYLRLSNKAIDEAMKKKNYDMVSEIHLSLGNYFRMYHNLDEAFRQTVAALKAKKTARAYNNIADLFLAINVPEDAIVHLRKAQHLLSKKSELNDFEIRLSYILKINYIEARILNGQLGEALYDASEIIDDAALNDRHFLKGHGYNLLGRVYKENGNHEEALKAHLASLECYEKIYDRQKHQVLGYIEHSMYYVGECYYNLRSYDLALKKLSNISVLTSDYYKLKIACLEALEDYEVAYTTSREFIDFISTMKEQDNQQLKSSFHTSMLALETAERADEYEVLYTTMKSLSLIGQQIIDADCLEDVLEVIYQQINQVMVSDSIMFGVVEGDVLHYQYIFEDDCMNLGFKVDIKDPNSLGSWVIREKKSILINEAADLNTLKRYKENPTIVYHGQTTESLILVPIMVKEHVYGVLSIQAEKVNQYTGYDVEVIHTLASFIGIAMKNWQSRNALEQVNEKLRMVSETDALTGIKNRHHLSVKVEEIFSNDSAYQKVGIIIVDVDHFKEYNDNYGHLKGDACLQKIADTLRVYLSSDDELLFRYGGDEFVVLLKDVDQLAILGLLESTKLAINQLNIEHAYSDVACHVTCTFGYTVVERGHDYQSAFYLADEALYQAKGKGKNTIAFKEGNIG